MSGGCLKQAFILGLVACLSTGVCHADQSKSRARRPVPHEQPAPPPVAPVVPLRPEQMPATPPVITFADGQLTITATNSTLGDILRGVRNQTGANVDVPSNATERVVGIFGPGPARDVLSSLLNGSHFNYVLMGSATNAEGLDRVILTTKPVGTDRPAEQAVAAPPVPAPSEPQSEGLNFGDDQSEQNQDSADIFGSADEQNTQAEDQQQNPFGQPNDVRTPEQMLQDLQRQQQGQQAGQQPAPFGGTQPGPFGTTPPGPFRGGVPNPRGGIQPPQPSPQ